jgi:hypothetical protein
MKKVFSLGLALVLLLSVVGMAGAQGTRSTAFQIVNLGGSDADMYIYYYDATDGSLTCQDTVTALGSFKSVQFNQAADCSSAVAACICGETSWQGSVVIESTESIAVITNINEPAGAGANVLYAGGSYDGIEGTRTADSIVFPFIMHDYYTYNTDFAVQNAGGGDATIYLDYYKTGESAAQKTEGPFTVKEGASYYRDQKVDDTDLGATWSGVVVVRSDQPVAGVVNENPNTQGTLLNYEGFASGDTSIYMPFLAKTYYGFSTAFQVVAMDAGTTGTISFYAPGATTPDATLDLSLGQYEALEWNMKTSTGYTTGSIPDGWSGAGVIELTGGSAVVIVNERGQTGAGYNLGLTYSGMNGSLLMDRMTFPFIIKNYANAKWNTAFQVMNVGTAGTVTVYYDAADGSGFSSYNWTSASLGANEPLECNQKLGACITSPLPDGWVGSVRVEGAAGVVLAGICNERGGTTTGDSGLVYNGFPY